MLETSFLEPEKVPEDPTQNKNSWSQENPQELIGKWKFRIFILLSADVNIRTWGWGAGRLAQPSQVCETRSSKKRHRPHKGKGVFWLWPSFGASGFPRMSSPPFLSSVSSWCTDHHMNSPAPSTAYDPEKHRQRCSSYFFLSAVFLTTLRGNGPHFTDGKTEAQRKQVNGLSTSADEWQFHIKNAADRKEKPENWGMSWTSWHMLIIPHLGGWGEEP